MSQEPQRYLFLPGAAGGGEHDMAAFSAGLEHPIHFETISYPGWRRYVEDDFSAETLIAELTADVAKRAPAGPIRLIGVSLGGHFGYAIALRLQQTGREIEMLCAIDSFMVASSQPSAGWRSRALSDAFDLIRKRRFGELAQFVRSKAWRAAMRLAGGRLAGLLRSSSGGGQLPSIFGHDDIAEQELSMRLLLREVAPWVAGLDCNPIAMNAPAILLRTEATAGHDAAWRLRCPRIEIREVPGKHLTLFEAENINALREAFVEASGAFTTPR